MALICFAKLCRSWLQLNGITTQGENIADNGGLKESFKVNNKLL